MYYCAKIFSLIKFSIKFIKTLKILLITCACRSGQTGRFIWHLVADESILKYLGAKIQKIDAIPGAIRWFSTYAGSNPAAHIFLFQTFLNQDNFL